MRIALDGARAATHREGLGNYGRFVIRSLATHYPDCQIDVYVPNLHKEDSLLSDVASFPNVKIICPKNPIYVYIPWLWREIGVPLAIKRSHADIFHGLSNVLPYLMGKVKGCRFVVTIHDLIFVSFPYSYTWLQRHRYNFTNRRACRKADRIVAVSEFTAREIVKYYFIPKDKISVIYQGCESLFSEPCSEGFKDLVRHHYSLPNRYILTEGTLHERKNVELAVRALPSIDPEISLVMVGRKKKYAEKVLEVAKECGVLSRILILDNVSHKELPAIFQMAEAFVFPSKIEGFGIPVLEAMNSHIPVLTATGSSLEEAGGEAAIYVDPENLDEFASKLNELLDNEALRTEKIEKGCHQASSEKFSEKAMAESLMSLYQSLT
ncbi:MAG: glycosyltransferase family 4 protein [Candidatus Cryptobacteroides sp.]